MRLVHRQVLAAIDSGKLKPLFQFLLGNMSKTDRQAPKDLIACSKGCSHCCHMWVSATAPEILFVAAELGRTRVAIDRIMARIGATQGLSYEQRQTFVSPCPMLTEDGACGVYSVRPIMCRTAASADAEICRRGYLELSDEQIPTPIFYALQRAGYMTALRGGFKRAGLSLVSYEFNAALAVALDTPDAERRWLSGEDIFDGVLIDPFGDPLDHPSNHQLYSYAFADHD